MNCCLKDNDRCPATHLQDTSRNALRELLTSLSMLDSLCVLDDDVNRFTWCSADKSMEIGLDYIFLTKNGIITLRLPTLKL